MAIRGERGTVGNWDHLPIPIEKYRERRQRCRVVIPSNPTRRVPRRFNKKLYKRRHHVENFFQRLKRYRRVATRYEKLASNFFAMVCLAAALIWLL